MQRTYQPAYVRIVCRCVLAGNARQVRFDYRQRIAHCDTALAA
jgi:hypothetical protein